MLKPRIYLKTKGPYEHHPEVYFYNFFEEGWRSFWLRGVVRLVLVYFSPHPTQSGLSDALGQVELASS